MSGEAPRHVLDVANPHTKGKYRLKLSVKAGGNRGLSDGQNSIKSWAETGSTERNSLLDCAWKNFATGPRPTVVSIVRSERLVPFVKSNPCFRNFSTCLFASRRDRTPRRKTICSSRPMCFEHAINTTGLNKAITVRKFQTSEL